MTAIPVLHKLIFMGDLEDDIQFQPILQDIADYTVVPLRADNQANLAKSTYVSRTIVNGMRNKNTE